jgi:hypothetical protein
MHHSVGFFKLLRLPLALVTIAANLAAARGRKSGRRRDNNSECIFGVHFYCNAVAPPHSRSKTWTCTEPVPLKPLSERERVPCSKPLGLNIARGTRGVASRAVLKQFLSFRVEVLHEPLEEWHNGNEGNLLENFYAGPKRNYLSFQRGILALLTKRLLSFDVGGVEIHKSFLVEQSIERWVSKRDVPQYRISFFL